MDPLRWQSWHFSCKIGAISLANVGSAAREGPDSVRKALKASAPTPTFRRTQNLASLIVRSFSSVFWSLSGRLVVYLDQKRVSKVGGWCRKTDKNEKRSTKWLLYRPLDLFRLSSECSGGANMRDRIFFSLAARLIVLLAAISVAAQTTK